jgi:hypothetical protein
VRGVEGGAGSDLAVTDLSLAFHATFYETMEVLQKDLDA